MEVRTRPISTQALFSRLIGVPVVGGFKSWNFETNGDVFFSCGLRFLLEMKTMVWLKRKETKHLRVLMTKLSTFKHPVFSSSAGGFYRRFGKIRARFYSVLKKVECCWVRSWLKKAKLKLPKIRRRFSWGKAENSRGVWVGFFVGVQLALSCSSHIGFPEDLCCPSFVLECFFFIFVKKGR